MRLVGWLGPVILALLLGGFAPVWAAVPLLWFAEDRPTVAAAEALAILAAADEDGLDPRDYGIAALGQAVERARQNPTLDPAAQARLDGALTAALLHYLADRRQGRIDPRQVHANFSVPRTAPLPTVSFLQEAIAARRLSAAVRESAPRLPMYDSLRRTLAHYRLLLGHPAWQHPLPRLPGRKLEAGQDYAGLAQLAERLQALGDLAAEAALPARYEEPLRGAVMAFQQRHGLTADGVLGPATLAQLEVTPERRLRQIELSLERLRWTPYLQAPRMIAVNIPEFMLRAYEVREGQVQVALRMRIIVGKALDTQTPLFSVAMRQIEFRPYWNVPWSIAREEIVPTLQRKPAYFEQQGFEFVSDRGAVVTTLTTASLEEVRAGRWRIRQRPGPLNALGDIKFVFPNNQAIYLHHTPAPQLFERERRDFSHGCIRVEDPVALARFVLQDQQEWTAERIRAAMTDGEPGGTVRLQSPVPVLIAYSTVVVQAGRVHFYPDLYGHDRLLDQALRRHAGSQRRQTDADLQAK